MKYELRREHRGWHVVIVLILASAFTVLAACGNGTDETCQNGKCADQDSIDTNSLPIGSTWKDPTSGLTWQVTSPTGYHYWDEAKSYCNSLSLGGHSDWRLPSIGELRTLIRGCPATESGGSCNMEEDDCLAWSCRDDSCDGCSRYGGQGSDGMYWPNETEGGCCWYWSSSVVEGTGDDAWGVSFNRGGISVTSVGGVSPFRCVR